ncbi:FecCD family ABC transporter permease [Rheinheimera sp. 4Y26]|uniref:FecCD family ABC transporter permease n=1 Tax=Rheinheimera sp. 4Y26 TaxID=2977811 RepID=UPI0021B157E2|nr:iron ABC transporter permease [Rheinheimera sp. 4Y26]MCT6699098.1 iron ABC transporter permease [Rheinheimera sp. 4Y26]
MKSFALPQRWLLLFLLALGSFLFCLNTGSVSLQWQELWWCFTGECTDPMQWQLIWQLRLPRLLLGFVAGAGLALSGALLQHLSRNPLADPYLFGVIAGAGLGATVASLYFPALLIALPLAAFVGALLAIALVLVLALLARWQQLDHFILAGVAVSFLFSAATALLLYQHDPFAANRVMFWLMGSLSRASYQPLWFILPCLLLCLLLAVLFRRQLDAMLWSDQTALSLGVPVQPLRLLFLLLTAALTASIVAYCGGIGFVGLMVPHLVRMLLGSQALSLFVGSCLCGGIFLIWVDAGARTLMPSQELPLGVITSACGSLFFLLLLSRRRG